MIEIVDSYPTAVVHAGEGASNEAPQGALVLRVVTDYDTLAADGTTAGAALSVMRSRDMYDPRVMHALAAVVGAGVRAVSVREVGVKGLEVGMTLEGDVRNVGGRLLLVRGQEVTEQLLERLANLPPRTVREPIRVVDPAC